jgi:hypothetical protein
LASASRVAFGSTFPPGLKDAKTHVARFCTGRRVKLGATDARACGWDGLRAARRR